MLDFLKEKIIKNQMEPAEDSAGSVETKKGISTANPSDVSEGAVLLAYIYSIPDFSASANFCRIFFAGGGIAWCFRQFCLAG